MKARWEIRPGLVYQGEVFEHKAGGGYVYLVFMTGNLKQGEDGALTWWTKNHATREAALEDARAHGITLEE